MSLDNDLELGLQSQSNGGPDPDEEQDQNTGGQGDPDQSRTDQHRTEHQSSSIKFFKDKYRGASISEDPDVSVFEYVRNQHGNIDLHTISFESWSDWVQQLAKANVEETSNVTEIQGNLQVLLLRGDNLESCLENFLQTRRVPQQEIKALCAMLKDPSASTIEQSTDGCFYLGWKKISSITTRTAFEDNELARKVSRAEDAREFNYFLNRPRPLVHEHIWCFWISDTVVLAHRGSTEHVHTTEERRLRFTSITQRLAKELAHFNPQNASKPILMRSIQEKTCRSILDDEYEILTQIEEELENIDIEMGLPNMGVRDQGSIFTARDIREILKLKMVVLKKNMGEWRSHILHRHNLQRQIERIMKSPANSDGNQRRQQDTLDEFDSKLNGTLRHFESTFAALIGTMSINESTRAIEEAEEVTKLTQLASFFIPLSFVTGLFGMNLRELANLSIWVWAVTSTVLLSITFFVLYPRGTIKFLDLALYTTTVPIWFLPACFIMRKEMTSIVEAAGVASHMIRAQVILAIRNL